jgi:hypothetical protein
VAASVATAMPRILLVMVLTLLVAAPAAMAGTRSDIIRDCTRDGKLDGNYSPSEIRDARNNLPDDIDQYYDCRDVLSRALGGTGDKSVGGGDAGDGSGGAGGGAGGSSGPSQPLTPAGPEEQAERDKAAIEGGGKPIQVGDGTIVPAADIAHNTIPPALLAVLIMLGLAALAGAVPFVRRRVLARRLT